MSATSNQQSGTGKADKEENDDDTEQDPQCGVCFRSIPGKQRLIYCQGRMHLVHTACRVLKCIACSSCKRLEPAEDERRILQQQLQHLQYQQQMIGNILESVEEETLKREISRVEHTKKDIPCGSSGSRKRTHETANTAGQGCSPEKIARPEVERKLVPNSTLETLKRQLREDPREFRTVRDHYASQLGMYLELRQYFYSECSKVRDFRTNVYVFVGESRQHTLRTACMLARLLDPTQEPYMVRDQNMWDTYLQETCVVIDTIDMMDYDFKRLCNLCDNQPLLVRYRGGKINFASKHLFITACNAPKYWFTNVDMEAFVTAKVNLVYNFDTNVFDLLHETDDIIVQRIIALQEHSYDWSCAEDGISD